MSRALARAGLVLRRLTPFLLATLVTACGAGGGATPSGSPADAAAGTVLTTPVLLADWSITPAEVTVAADFTLVVSNEGPTPHNLTIRDQAGAVGHALEDLAAGDSGTLTGSLVPGRYVLFCSLPAHENRGMRATLVVLP